MCTPRSNVGGGHTVPETSLPPVHSGRRTLTDRITSLQSASTEQAMTTARFCGHRRVRNESSGKDAASRCAIVTACPVQADGLLSRISASRRCGSTKNFEHSRYCLHVLG